MGSIVQARVFYLSKVFFVIAICGTGDLTEAITLPSRACLSIKNHEARVNHYGAIVWHSSNVLIVTERKSFNFPEEQQSCHNNGNPIDPIARGREAQSIGYTNSRRKPRQSTSSMREQDPELYSS